VGGQGTILASKILSEALVRAGYDVKMSEVHGMSQRGGSVSTQIRYGGKVYSPIIGAGETDVMVAFEKMEALRWIKYLKPDGRIVVNDFEIPSAPILMGDASYPGGIIEALGSAADVLVVDAARIAGSVGNARVMNIVLLGALAKALGVEGVDWESTIHDNVKAGFGEINHKAFQAGYEAC
jgi:indolepyruvate ferredoxin oxidoreductase beta subunit